MRTRYPISYNEVCGVMMPRKMPLGTKIWFSNEKQGYTVRASNVAYCVLTKPFNAKSTVLYTIIDWRSEVRGPEDRIFSLGAETDEQCEEMLQRLTNDESEVSSRHYLDLDIVKMYDPVSGKTYEK